MRFVTFHADGGSRPGLLTGGGSVVDLSAALPAAVRLGMVEAAPQPRDLVDVIAGGPEVLDACRAILEHAGGELAEAVRSADEVVLAAPIPRPRKNVFCVGSNYRAHVSESNRAQSLRDVAPEYPVFFTKPPTAVVGPGAAIRINPAMSEKMDYEVELGVVISRAGRDIPAAAAPGHIFRFTIINDVTARDLQRRHKQFLKGKGLDTTCPMGPMIVTIDELPNFQELSVRTEVNGEVRQDGNTRDMIFPVPALLESLSEGLTLEPGDVLATGTPEGVGYAMDPPKYLRDGDTITCSIEGIGELTNVVRDAAAAEFAA